MGHYFVPTKHPNLVQMKITGHLNYEDMTCEDELGLNEKPVWVILDVIGMNISLPEGFLSGARHSWFVNPNTQHLALVVSSGFIKSVGLMVAKVTRRRDRLTVYDSVEAAETHLLGLIQKSGLVTS